MRVATAVLAAVLLGAGSAAAQDVSGGVKGGVNFANLVIDGDAADLNLETRIGLVIGGFVTWPVTPRFDIQPEALVSMKGASFDEFGVEADIEITYLRVSDPVPLRISDLRRHVAQAVRRTVARLQAERRGDRRVSRNLIGSGYR